MDFSNTSNSPTVPDFWLSDFLCQKHDQIEPLIATPPPRNNKVQKLFLVQFSRHSGNLMHAIVTQNEVSWPAGSGQLSPDVFVNDGQQIMPGRLLFVHDNEDCVKTELTKLKFWCFQKGFNEDDNSTTIGPNTWLLVFYTFQTSNVVYAIINNRDTFQGITNPYEDVVCYLNYGNNIYQALIVRKSEDFEEIFEAMTTVKNSYLELQFPLELDANYEADNAVPPPGFQSLCGTVEEFLQNNDHNNCVYLEKYLEEAERRMQNDHEMIFELLNSSKQFKKETEQYKNYLDGLASLAQPTDLANVVETDREFY